MASGNRRTGSPARLLVGTLLALCVGMVACASSQPVQAAKADFNGVWSVKLCDEANPQLQCGSFDLYLTQNGDRICGDHFVATPGLSRLDESDPGTVIGTFNGKSAVLLINSTRNNAWYLANGEISGTDLVWRRVGMAVAGLDDEPPIIPKESTLSQTTAPEYIKHLKELESAPCQWADQQS